MHNIIVTCRKGAAKNRLVALITILLLLAVSVPASAAGSITVFFNEVQRFYDPGPQIINNRVLVPMRAVFEDLGAEVSWDAGSRTAMAFKNGKYVSVKIGSKQGTTADAVKVNGQYQLSNIQTKTLDAAPTIINNRTMLPIRFVSESLGAKVEWVAARRQVLIDTSGTTVADPASGTEMRGAWLSFNDLANFDTAKIDAFLDAAVAMKLNTVFVHARAFSDSFYKSSLFPWSHWLTGIQGQAPAVDPLQYVITGGHQRGLRVEAWINPYRISTTTELTNSLAPNNPAVKWLNDPAKVIHYQVNGQECLIYNPASPEVRSLITSGVLEIVNNYAVDGVHFDDYFYVSGMKEAYDTAYKENQVNQLVRQVYAAVKNAKPSLAFGISPAGNIANCNLAGADVQTWLSQDGYVDYVCPQIYWTNQYTTARYQFNNCLNDWVALKKNPRIKLYTGLALYRVGTSVKTDPGWLNRSDNMLTQVQQIRKTGQCSGFILFDISDLISPTAKTELSNLKTVL